MKTSRLSSHYPRAWFAHGIGLTLMLALAAASGGASAQEGQGKGQGKYITEASLRLAKLVNSANADGYILKDNLFSIGGGWLKQDTKTWVPLFTIPLDAGKEYRFLASGDGDAKDVDLQIVDPNGKVVASDEDTAADAVVNYRPNVAGRYTVQLRLYASEKNVPCVCLGIMTVKK